MIWVLGDISDSQPVNDGLTPREREIAARVANGMSNEEIARELDVNHRTARRARLT